MSPSESAHSWEWSKGSPGPFAGDHNPSTLVVPGLHLWLSVTFNGASGVASENWDFRKSKPAMTHRISLTADLKTAEDLIESFHGENHPLGHLSGS